MGTGITAVYDFPADMIRLSASLNLVSHGNNWKIISFI